MMVKCVECRYWVAGRGQRTGLGECRLRSPEVRRAQDTGVRASWPVTLCTDGCWEGVAVEDTSAVTRGGDRVRPL